MQYHLNGFRPGDPHREPAAPSTGGELPDEVDVLIVGTGPAGLVLAAQLAAFPGIRTRIVERRLGPLELGQADGVACRTVEMFEAFGMAPQLLQEAAWVTETRFWGPDAADRTAISRTGIVQDVEDGLSEFPHIIVNQARIQEHLLERMAKSAARSTPDYGLEFVALERRDGDEYPVRVTLRHTHEARMGDEVVVAAKYVVGCDGARSAVRRAIGRELRGDSANQSWGVIDVLARTDFPDIRFKAVIQSAEGNIVLIPREGGYLVRFYIELDELAEGERVASRSVTADYLLDAARRILHPYTLDAQEVVWWSVYEIGQRLTDKFDDVDDAEIGERTPRVFIAGDACHTHSPKAGQGMNVSMQDAFNLGWKLAAVLEGRSAPELLHSYSAERQAVAHELIEFDREWAGIVSQRPLDPAHPEEGGIDPREVLEYFAKQGRYTAGVATRYTPSLLTGDGAHQELASGFRIGERFHSAPVVRVGDAKPLELGHAARADGRWRLYLFADAAEPDALGSRLRALCDRLLDDPASPLRRHTRDDADIDAAIDVRAILRQPLHELELGRLPRLLRPAKGRYGLIDHEKAFVAGRDADIFALRGVDPAGCIVVVRPDQYVAHVLPLDAFDALSGYFAGHMTMVDALAEVGA